MRVIEAPSSCQAGDRLSLRTNLLIHNFQFTHELGGGVDRLGTVSRACRHECKRTEPALLEGMDLCTRHSILPYLCYNQAHNKCFIPPLMGDFCFKKPFIT